MLKQQTSPAHHCYLPKLKETTRNVSDPSTLSFAVFLVDTRYAFNSTNVSSSL
ncbi:MAG: hypothetical protein LBH74_03800 [Nitrososphaerota archaeon]|uniref:hypothetical protein n=1 Tax=Candidatus Bathycorpusculum sp. TaxID=2994959 RepID=UPI0028312E16|nr:hypothetical protein [Candidatus Termitimicrobium sp.]MCL2431892.1 hypothetical protein [Candidatus Termitimicrobium sp.]MDR0492747.1 hypothetical protein [Nitrososphaerota archaeon]